VQAPLNGLSLAVAPAASGLLYGSRHIAARSLGNGLKGRVAQAWEHLKVWPLALSRTGKEGLETPES
jgi:hypothetical protein